MADGLSAAGRAEEVMDFTDLDENTMEGYAEGDTMADVQATGWDSGNEMMANDAPAEDGDAMEGDLMEGDPMEDGQGQDHPPPMAMEDGDAMPMEDETLRSPEQ